jgi:hypothetical protein
MLFKQGAILFAKSKMPELAARGMANSGRSCRLR